VLFLTGLQSRSSPLHSLHEGLKSHTSQKPHPVLKGIADFVCLDPFYSDDFRAPSCLVAQHMAGMMEEGCLMKGTDVVDGLKAHLEFVASKVRAGPKACSSSSPDSPLSSSGTCWVLVDIPGGALMSVRSEEGESMDVKVDTLVDMITKSRPDFEASSSLKPKEQLSLEPYFPDEALLLMRFKTKSRFGSRGSRGHSPVPQENHSHSVGLAATNVMSADVTDAVGLLSSVNEAQMQDVANGESELGSSEDPGNPVRAQ